MAPHHARRSSPVKWIVIVIVVLLVIYGVFSLLQPGVTSITAAKTLSLSVNQTLFFRINNGGAAAIRLVNVTANHAIFYVTSLPVLYNPVVVVSLAAASSANISSNATQSANMNLELVSSSASGATIIVTPWPTSVKTSSDISLITPVSFTLSGSAATTTATTTTVTLTTTVSGSGTSTATTTAAITTTKVTTTVAAVPASFQQALTLLNQTNIGMLMINYKALYIKDAACTSNVYNATYHYYYTGAIPGPESFENVSAETPTNININETEGTAANSVIVTYVAVTPSASWSGPAVKAVLNTGATVALKNVTYTGIYTGLNYTTLSDAYNFQSGVSGACGAYITPT